MRKSPLPRETEPEWPKRSHARRLRSSSESRRSRSADFESRSVGRRRAWRRPVAAATIRPRPMTAQIRIRTVPSPRVGEQPRAEQPVEMPPPVRSPGPEGMSQLAVTSGMSGQIGRGVSRSQNSSGLLAQLLELMGQDARQQPWAWHDDQAQLPKKREGVQLEPVRRDPSFDEAVELEAGE
jgi:hypothetical protein